MPSRPPANHLSPTGIASRLPQTVRGAIFQGAFMFTPNSLGIALFMMITSAICWGSWANTYKGVKNYRFELFYWDYAIGIFLISMILGHTMGSTGSHGMGIRENIHAAAISDALFAMLGGAIFNLANLLLVAA